MATRLRNGFSASPKAKIIAGRQECPERVQLRLVLHKSVVVNSLASTYYCVNNDSFPL